MKLKRIKMSKNKKIMLGTLGGLVLLLGILGIIKSTFAIDDSDYLNVQIVDDLEFTNAFENYTDNIYTFNVEVTNTKEEEYKLKTIDVVFKDKNNNEIEILNGYIGDSLGSKEKKILSVSVDKEIKDIGSISYIINK